MTTRPSQSSVSAALSISHRGSVSAVISQLKGVAAQVADSAVLTVRGSRSEVIELLSRLEGAATHVSAAISIRGDKAAQLSR